MEKLSLRAMFRKKNNSNDKVEATVTEIIPPQLSKVRNHSSDIFVPRQLPLRKRLKRRRNRIYKGSGNNGDDDNNVGGGDDDSNNGGDKSKNNGGGGHFDGKGNGGDQSEGEGEGGGDRAKMDCMGEPGFSYRYGYHSGYGDGCPVEKLCVSQMRGCGNPETCSIVPLVVSV